MALRYDLTLRDLTARCAAGDRAALAEIVLRHRGVVLAVGRAHRLAPEDIEDVAQVTWGAFADRVGTIRDPEAIPAWLARTARHEALRVLRLRGREVLVESDLERPGQREPYPSERHAERDEHERRAVSTRSAIDALPERDRALVLFLLAYPEASYREISAALDMPIGSIGPIRARAFGRVRERLEAAGITGALVDS